MKRYTISFDLCINFSHPFHAIITPLSVQYLTGGHDNLTLNLWHKFWILDLMYRFDATPPDTTRFLTLIFLYSK
ncbi:hypothetical protein BpHYR1_038986 [Brachionus plicatilis]|uniref:Uncharacterized protein n=1 Tax=Brachionus plicatilis TaxID=10195 RepID=A0A3M7R712_BRAPC|nr:hypothetical protein BpHYR1_038986 [Brachionus plicatilis]